MFRLFKREMKVYLFEHYQEAFPGLRGRELTEFLIREVMKGYDICDAEILRTSKGKPYLKEGPFFSVSHSGGCFACLVDERPVGIDIQQRRSVKAREIGKRYFTAEEREYLAESGDSGFFFLWTRKEAYSKYTGRGLEEILKGTSVLNRRDVEFVDFQLEKGLYCSCCIEKRQNIR